MNFAVFFSTAPDYTVSMARDLFDEMKKSTETKNIGKRASFLACLELEKKIDKNLGENFSEGKFIFAFPYFKGNSKSSPYIDDSSVKNDFLFYFSSFHVTQSLIVFV